MPAARRLSQKREDESSTKISIHTKYWLDIAVGRAHPYRALHCAARTSALGGSKRHSCRFSQQGSGWKALSVEVHESLVGWYFIEVQGFRLGFCAVPEVSPFVLLTKGGEGVRNSFTGQGRVRVTQLEMQMRGIRTA